MDLASVQSALADFVRRQTSLTGDAAAASVAKDIAAGNERLSPVEQIDIYREQFFLRHVDCLRDDFRAIEHLLGDERFAELARAYLEAHPPTSFTLRDLGASLADLVATRPPWSDDALLADLARVEWAFVDAFDAADAPAFDPASLAGVAEEAWPNARIFLDPALQRLALSFPAHEYRAAARSAERTSANEDARSAQRTSANEDVGARENGDGSTEVARPAPRACFVVVYRGPELLHYREVDHDAFALLSELAEGACLAEACERAARSSAVDPDVFQEKLGALFQDWTAAGWIRRVEF